MKKQFIHKLSNVLENNSNVHKELLKKIEIKLKSTLVCYYCTPLHPWGALMDHDPDIIEQMLRGLDFDKYDGDATLLLTTPGGMPYAAGKIVKVFRTYSKVFKTLVVTRSLSAGTLVCLGSDELIMTETASLGPIDPQLQLISPSKQGRLVSAEAIIKAFNDMIREAQAAIIGKQPPDPFYHILNTMDVTQVIESIRAKNATEKMAEVLLRTGLLKNNPKKIKKVVKWFIAEGAEEQHGKHLYPDNIISQGIEVTIIPIKSDIDYLIAELHTRIERYSSGKSLAKYLLSRQGGMDINVNRA